MDLIDGKVTIERNMQSFQKIGSNIPIQVEGRLEIFGEGKVKLKESEKVLEHINNKEKLEFYANDDAGDCWLIENCQITSFDLCGDTNGTYEASIEFVGENVKPAIIEVNFKDCSKEIRYDHYRKIKENHNLEKITYNEFKDFVMVEEI